MTLRGLLAALLALLLGGCWIGDSALFAPEDLARVELDGAYELGASFPEGSLQQAVRFEQLAEGRLRVVPLVTPGETEQEFSEEREGFLSLIAIPDGPDGWYLAALGEEGPSEVQFYIAHHENAGLALYAPGCDRTPQREGMERMFEDGGSRTCRFTSRKALLDAAAEAVGELSATRIFAIAPMVTIRPAYRTDDVYEEQVPE
jgi:hypothetical protein